jgi:hypothetical protein
VNKRAAFGLITIIYALLLTGCSLIPGMGEETPPATGEPAGDQVIFIAPYRAVLDEGEGVPGARLEYVGQDDDGIHVRIDGEDAYKKTGDSFNWRGSALVDAAGSTAAGVELDFKLRVVGVVLDVFQAWGEVDIIMSDPVPVAADLPEDAPLVFTAAVANYKVAKGDIVPGTTYTYLGSSDKGAEFGGLEGYAYREVADSLDWSGQVRPNVYSDLSMRVSSIDDQEVSLLGTATVWIFP